MTDMMRDESANYVVNVRYEHQFVLYQSSLYSISDN